MATKKNASIPKSVDLNKLIEMGKAAGKEFKEDSIRQVNQEDNTQIANPFEKNSPESFSAAQHSDAPVSQEQPAKGVIKDKEEDLTNVLASSEIPFEDYLKKFIPLDTDRRESAYIYTSNLYILKSIATSEKAKLNDMINNILASWIQKHHKNIKKSLQKPSKSFGI